MKKIFKSILLVASAALFMGCQEAYHENDTYVQLHDDNAVETYALRSVVEYDPFNPTGVDITAEFEEFETLRFIIYYKDGAISALEFDNGDIPFTPGIETLPEGKVNCSYDSSVFPPVIRLESGEAFVKMVENQPVFEFSLDYNKISYEYKFKAVSAE